MPDLSWAAIVRLVHERAGNCCEYCCTCQRVCGQSMHVEHIDPDGNDEPENLCLACPLCNFSKARATTAFDMQTNTTVPLFNPRQDHWKNHFEWLDEGAIASGKTAAGRATVQRLRMNTERIVTARKIWGKAGAHPPE